MRVDTLQSGVRVDLGSALRTASGAGWIGLDGSGRSAWHHVPQSFEDLGREFAEAGDILPLSRVHFIQLRH